GGARASYDPARRVRRRRRAGAFRRRLPGGRRFGRACGRHLPFRRLQRARRERGGSRRWAGGSPMIAFDVDRVDFAKGDGLVCAVAQDELTLQVLMVAWMDRAALEETLHSGEATFYSRSRQERWRKGETSGNRLRVKRIEADCDGDA